MATAPAGSVLVDLAGFLTRDVMGIVQTLKAPGQWAVSPVATCRWPMPPRSAVFPENLEFEARQTFAVATPGPGSATSRRTPSLVTLTVRHSLIKLPSLAIDTRLRPALRRLQTRSPTMARRWTRTMVGSWPIASGWRRPIPTAAALAGQEADRLLRRPRRARADPHRAERGRLAGGPRRSRRPASSTPTGWRSCPRAPTRWTSATTSSTGSTAPRAAGPTARRHRPAHRRDRQGHGAAGLAARAPGHADLRGPGRRRPGRYRRAQRSGPGLALRASASSRARGRPRPGLRSTISRQHPGPRLGDGLSGASGATVAGDARTSPTRMAAAWAAWDRLRHRRAVFRTPIRPTRARDGDATAAARPALRHRRGRARRRRRPSRGAACGTMARIRSRSWVT